MYKQTCWFIMQGNGSVLLNKNSTFPDEQDVFAIKTHFIRHFALGSVDDISYFCAEIADHFVIEAPWNTVSLRQALALLGFDNYSIGVKACSVLNWDKNHQFCGRCGARTVHESNHYERICQACTLSFFPRISPSVIVLIYKDDQLVMARSPHFLPGVYGLIAGFVDSGETLEQAAHREIYEEVGLKVKNLSYFGSQSWPFPDSLMVAFTAEYDSGELTIDNIEIEEAGWYKYDNLPGRPSLPMSIASRLLDSFIAQCS